MSDDSGFWIGAAILVVGGLWWWNSKEDESPPPIETKLIEPGRPTGRLFATSLENGTTWSVDADSLKGPRSARMTWVFEDHSKNKSVSSRETRTLYEINCDRGSYITRSVIDYDAKGNVGARATDSQLSDEPDFAPPQSRISAVLEQACDPAFDRPQK